MPNSTELERFTIWQHRHVYWTRDADESRGVLPGSSRLAVVHSLDALSAALKLLTGRPW